MRIFNISIVLATLLLPAFTMVAQEEKPNEPQFLLSKSNNLSFSGFGGPIVEFSSVDGELGVSSGGGGGVLINQTFFLGGYGMGLATDMPQYDISIKNPNTGYISNYYNRRPMLAHGGFWLGYMNQSHKIFHWAVSSKIGWGAVSLIDKEYRDMENELGWDGIFVLTPQAEFEVNLLKWFKINFGLGYRYVAGVNQIYVNATGEKVNYFDSGAFNSPVGSITFMFGNFTR